MNSPSIFQVQASDPVAVETTTGVTGFQPVNPPEPQFSPDIRPGEPDRTALSVSDSAGSVVLPSLVGSMILALLALF